ncbi:hypothetical protein [Alloyangia pacifica]|uniref:hypothetical protein n=1 Tax=Alloyangia pacifica TaxID=311180 RepID=UPI001CD1ECA6|nr:hypothetical protein [Alloyangia pacifica]MCA0993918.1 hypothetical protein [Alloyangia pacifica]
MSRPSLLRCLLASLLCLSAPCTGLQAADQTPDLGPALVLRRDPVLPAPIASAAPDPRVVVRDDAGGPLRPRLRQVQRLRAQGARVELRGRFCNSACTLLLGAGNVCVSPQTRFGFHGPHYLAGTMSADRFDHWSARMAETYPPPLRGWFLSRARFAGPVPLTLTGAQLIAMGVAPC